MRRIAATLVTAFSLAACGATGVEEPWEAVGPPWPPPSSALLQPGEAIVVLAGKERADQSPSKCISKALAEDVGMLRVVEEKEFRKALNLRPETDLLTTSYIKEILKTDLVKERLEDMGARYILIVSGSKTEVGGWMNWISQFSATAYDVKYRVDVGTFKAKAKGWSRLANNIPPTDTAACMTLAERLVRYFTGGENDPKSS